MPLSQRNDGARNKDFNLVVARIKLCAQKISTLNFVSSKRLFKIQGKACITGRWWPVKSF